MVGISAVFVLINDGRLNDSESNRFAWFKSILLDWSFAFLKETLSPARSDNDADDPKTPAKAEDVKLMKDEEFCVLKPDKLGFFKVDGDFLSDNLDNWVLGGATDMV